MFEKINPYIDALKSVYASYVLQKKWFRKKNADTLAELEANPEMLRTVREKIEIYDRSNFLKKWWISVFWSVGYYKEIIQHYDLHICIQGISSDTFLMQEKIDFLDEMIALLETWAAPKKIKEEVIEIQHALSDIRSELYDSDIFSVVPVGGSKYVASLPDVTPRSLQEVKAHNTHIVNNMIDLLREMREINWKQLVHEDADLAYKCYNGLMEKFDIALKRYSQLRILSHPDHQNVEGGGDLFMKVQTTYHTYKAQQKYIKKHVEAYGLESLNQHVPQEEQSVVDLLEALNKMIQAYVEKCDAHLEMLNRYLPKQKEKLNALAEAVDAHTEGLKDLKQEDTKQDQDLAHLHMTMKKQSEKLDNLEEERRLRSVQLGEQSKKMAEFDAKIKLATQQKIEELMRARGVEMLEKDAVQTQAPQKSSLRFM